MRVIVTRPARQAAAWVAELRAAGIDAVALPLIGIEGVEPGPLHAAWQALGQHRLVAFVSPNAVERFFAARPGAERGFDRLSPNGTGGDLVDADDRFAPALPGHGEVPPAPFAPSLSKGPGHRDVPRDPLALSLSKGPGHRDLPQAPFGLSPPRGPGHVEVPQAPFALSPSKGPGHRDVPQAPFALSLSKGPGHRDLAWPAATLAGSPGPGTTRALLAAGVPAAQIVEPPADAPAFDSESLWTVLAADDWTGRSVLIVRGDGGRDLLATRLTSAGAQVRYLCAYRRAAPVLDPAGSALLREAFSAPQAHGWFFSSSEAIERLQALVAPGRPVDDGIRPVVTPPDRRTAPTEAPSDRPTAHPIVTAADWRRSHAIATHPRIAATARAAGFGRVESARPSLAAVVACIQSFGP